MHDYSNLPKRGFSLAEVLLVLGLIGLLAVFTLPKVLMQNTTSLSPKQSAQTRNVALMLITAFERYRTITGTIPTQMADMTPYWNYVKLDVSGSLVDSIPTFGSRTCDSTIPCYRLHNGGVLYFWQSDRYCKSGNDPTGLLFAYDPDGKYGNTTDGPSKSIWMYLYSDGFVKTQANMKANTRWSNDGSSTCNSVRSAPDATDPSWFQGF